MSRCDRRRRPSPVRTAAVAGACLASLVLGGAVLADEVASIDAQPGPAVVDPVLSVDRYPLPGAPMDIVAAGDRTGYVSLRRGGILWFRVPESPGEPLETRRVVESLEDARGLAISDGVLYVVELGTFPCPDDGLCEGPGMPDMSASDGELTIIETMRARVLAYDIQPDGGLVNERTVLSDLPVVDSLHAVNGMEVGPDGRLYLSLGGVVRLWAQPAAVGERTPHPELMGTVIRFDGSGAAPEVWSRGLRNVYDLAFDDQGRLYGVDNDGVTQDGWLWEELLDLKQGADYAYPFQGTYSNGTARTDRPIWISQTAGTSGIAWSGDVGLGPGLLLGDCGRITWVEPNPSRPGERWEQRLDPESQHEIMGEVGGCVTSLEAIGDRGMVAAVFNDPAEGSLLRIRFAEPEAAPSITPPPPHPWDTPSPAP